LVVVVVVVVDPRLLARRETDDGTDNRKEREKARKLLEGLSASGEGRTESRERTKFNRTDITCGSRDVHVTHHVTLTLTSQ
jgi:hypothetical protein